MFSTGRRSDNAMSSMTPDVRFFVALTESAAEW